MFKSATIKLTGWYLLILMIISILFSVTVYNLSAHEIDSRLAHVQSILLHQPRLMPPPDVAFRQDQDQKAAGNILMDLFYVNIVILVGGGFGSYILARRTIRPIEEAHEAQSRFTSDASHELRTPLAAMKAEIEVTLRDKAADKSDLRDTLVSNLEEVEKLTQLSEMLLKLSRLEQDKLPHKPIHFYNLTKQTVKLFNQPDSRISITAHNRPVIEGNEAALTELVSILVDNALKYSPKDSLIAIRLSTTTHHFTFEITNTGKGIDPKVLPHIFDRFFQAETSRTGGEKKGYGLGLSLAKKIVELHRGELFATSAIDHATTFKFVLPIIRENQAKNQ